MGILRYIEYGIATMLIKYRAYDDQLFFKGPAFADFPEPTFELTSPDCGPTNSQLTKEYSMFGAGRIPELEWPAAGSDVKEYLLVNEDPDAPLGKPSVHGIYCFIPATRTSLGPADFTVVKEEDGSKVLSSGFRIGKNRRSSVYIPPRPPLCHGPHRYMFELIALSEPLDPATVSKVPTKQELAELVKGKVAGWGLWVATYENKWE